LHRSEAGFSLPELLVATAVLLIISGAVTSALMQMTNSQKTIWNRTEMHAGVRSATELLQQEVGQAGRVAVPTASLKLTGAVAPGAATVGVTSASGLFVNEQLAIVEPDNNAETVTLTGVNTAGNQITATFVSAHLSGTPILVTGGFASGIVPTNGNLVGGTAMANGSTGTILKMYGDINGDGNMVYIEYTCDTAGGNLYRNMMAWNAASKPALTSSQILLSNIQANPGGTQCFTYQQQLVGQDTYVTDVAITLTVQTQQKDPITQQYQTETKALLNVSPRNVFNVWELAGEGWTNRVQPMPDSVKSLLP
jgi:prepilin-type N-terminal cleavage/methylation domain-containing protein